MLALRVTIRVLLHSVVLRHFKIDQPSYYLIARDFSATNNVNQETTYLCLIGIDHCVFRHHMTVI